ncbi:hypothetical protein [Bacillus cereus]|uniref:Uncharacterized protein n=1 Tax=Bacillus cereus TaxID=1396 RepID=A0A2A7I343_BACCE|nr:hypothetical protein [Bacillus cereus]PEC23671.1 hypothetical protein COM96_00170 [Bacillus cereus]
MGRYPTITITTELDNSEYAIYSFGPTVEICEQYPDMYERWRFKILKDKITVEEGYVLLDDIPKEHFQLFYKCVFKIHNQVEDKGGMDNFKNIDLPDQISFII